MILQYTALINANNNNTKRYDKMINILAPLLLFIYQKADSMINVQAPN